MRNKATAALVALAATAAVGVTAATGAEQWDHGVSGGIVYSNYYNSSFYHMSSVSTPGGTTKSPCIRYGYFSYASRGSSVFYNNQYKLTCQI